MKRRNFLKTASPLMAAPFLLNGLSIRSYARTQSLDKFISLLGDTDRVLVLIQLSGGNDGINTVIPLDQMSVYNAVRSQVALPERKLLKISDSAALHPAMTQIQQMYNENKAVIVQGVSYPNPNLSHFRATDIWTSAAEYNQYLASGWAGRYLNTAFPNYPDGYPNSTMPDPPAIQMSAVMSLALQGPTQSMGIALNDPGSFNSLANGQAGGLYADPPNTRPGNELKFLRKVESESKVYAKKIQETADTKTNPNKATYPAARQNPLADQLAIVARLIRGGLKTRVYVVSLGGFDTHAAQVDSTDTTIGTHATLLGYISQAVGVFYDDLKQMGVDNRVLTMTFSEFGRRVESNASNGTDHGTAAPLFVFGTQVEAGIRGTNPSLTSLDNGNLKMQFDFRQVYASVLAQWFGADKTALNAAVLKDFSQIPIIKQGTVSAPAEDTNALFALSNFPNPVNGAGTTIRYRLPEAADVRLRILDVNGREVAAVVGEYQSAGEHNAFFSADRLPSGSYFYELRAGRRTASQRMVVEH